MLDHLLFSMHLLGWRAATEAGAGRRYLRPSVIHCARGYGGWREHVSAQPSSPKPPGIQVRVWIGSFLPACSFWAGCRSPVPSESAHLLRGGGGEGQVTGSNPAALHALTPPQQSTAPFALACCTFRRTAPSPLREQTLPRSPLSCSSPPAPRCLHLTSETDASRPRRNWGSAPSPRDARWEEAA